MSTIRPEITVDISNDDFLVIVLKTLVTVTAHKADVSVEMTPDQAYILIDMINQALDTSEKLNDK